MIRKLVTGWRLLRQSHSAWYAATLILALPLVGVLSVAERLTDRWRVWRRS